MMAQTSVSKGAQRKLAKQVDDTDSFKARYQTALLSRESLAGRWQRQVPGKEPASHIKQRNLCR